MDPIQYLWGSKWSKNDPQMCVMHSPLWDNFKNSGSTHLAKINSAKIQLEKIGNKWTSPSKIVPLMMNWSDFITKLIVSCYYSVDGHVIQQKLKYRQNLRYRDGTYIKGHDGHCLMKISKLDDFIRASTWHAANWGKHNFFIFSAIVFQWTMVHEVWKCSYC